MKIVAVNPKSSRNTKGRISWRTSEFDDLILKWNRRPPMVKQRIRRQCLQEGHQWAPVEDKGIVRFTMCRRCADFKRND